MHVLMIALNLYRRCSRDPVDKISCCVILFEVTMFRKYKREKNSSLRAKGSLKISLAQVYVRDEDPHLDLYFAVVSSSRCLEDPPYLSTREKQSSWHDSPPWGLIIPFLLLRAV